MTLNDEQLESILRGETPCPTGIGEADAHRLADARAIRARLASAMSSERAPQSLREKLAIASPPSPGPAWPGHPQVTAPARHAIFFRRWVPLAAAAAVLLAAGAALYVTQSPAQADMRELVAIHQANVGGASSLQPGGSPSAVADDLRRQLGTDVLVPTGDPAKAEVIGWRATTVAGQPGVSYVVRDKAGHKVSVVVSPAAPKDMGFKCNCGQKECRCTHEGQCAGCGLAARRAGGLTYCAVGDGSAKAARDVLASLTSQH